MRNSVQCAEYGVIVWYRGYLFCAEPVNVNDKCSCVSILESRHYHNPEKSVLQGRLAAEPEHIRSLGVSKFGGQFRDAVLALDPEQLCRDG